MFYLNPKFQASRLLLRLYSLICVRRGQKLRRLVFSQRGSYYFLTYALKHRLWILVRTAALGRFYLVSTIYVLNKNKKNITICHLKITICHLKINIFTAVTYSNILYGRVIVMHVETESLLSLTCADPENFLEGGVTIRPG